MGTQLSKSDDQLVAHPPAPSLPRPTLQSLPAELLSNIAFYLVLGQAQPGPPSSLLPLLLTHSTFNCLSFDNNPSLWARVFGATWDVSACLRRFASPGEQGVLADARLQADELRTRWTKLRVLREFAEDGRAWMRARQEKDAMDELEGAMIECWLILTENDGRNLPHVLQWARLVYFALAYHTLLILPSAVAPGYSEETVGRGVYVAISMWMDEVAEQRRLDLLKAGLATVNETEDQTQEKMFVLRPFTFAQHKYNPYFGPWNTPVLPLQPKSKAQSPAFEDVVERTSVFAADPEGNQGGTRFALNRFGREWRMKSTLLSFNSIFGLLNALDRDPRVGGVLTDSSGSSTRNLDFIYTPAEAALAPEGRTDTYDPISGAKLRRSVPVVQLPSQAWDNDVRRMMLCAEVSSPGMKLSNWIGKFEGEWQGSFAFFDFNGYRDMLAGDDKALFDNCFGQQGQQLILREEIVYVPRATLGGTGPALHCGFPLDAETPIVSRPCPFEEEALDDEEGSEWVKEMMIYGSGRSNWGSFKFRGRVRAYDGLITLLKEYASGTHDSTTATRGNWLYRGYVSADSRLIGTWRDTFSPEDVRGYEGPFSLRKQDEAYLLPERPLYPPASVHPTVSNFVEIMRSNSVSEPVAATLAEGDDEDDSASMPPSPHGISVMLQEVVKSLVTAPTQSTVPRLPFLYSETKPGSIAQTEKAMWDEHKALIQAAPSGYGVAIYNEINTALREAGCTSTQNIPTIHNPNLKRPRPETDDSESLPAPQKKECKPVWRFSGPSDHDEMADNMRAIASLASNAAPKDDPNPHHNIYGARAVPSVEPGQSIFTHRCDETLGKSHGEPDPLEKTRWHPSTTSTTVLETSTAGPSSASSL